MSATIGGLIGLGLAGGLLGMFGGYAAHWINMRDFEGTYSFWHTYFWGPFLISGGTFVAVSLLFPLLNVEYLIVNIVGFAAVYFMPGSPSDYECPECGAGIDGIRHLVPETKELVCPKCDYRFKKPKEE